MAHADNNNSSRSCLFIDTSLDTRFAIIVSHFDTISHLKRKIMLEHHQCFPAIGDIKIDSLKVKRRGHFYHLSDSMLVKSAFVGVKENWFLSVDASRLSQGVGIQQMDNNKVGDQLALPCATDNHSVDQGSPSAHLTTVQTANHVVSSVNQFTTGSSGMYYLKNTEEDRPFDNKINSKKRTLVQTESLVEDASGVEKKRKTEEKEAGVKASEDLGGENIRTNNENSMENNIQDLNDESTRLNIGEKCSGLDQEATVVSSSIENKNTEASEIIVPDVFMSLEKNIEQEIPSEISQKEKGESPLVQNNSEASETAPAAAVLMVVEENIQQEIASEISQKEKENELVEERVTGNEISQKPVISSETSQKEKGESPLVRNNSEANESAPAVLMAVEENIQQDIPSEISQKEKENKLVKERVTGNEIPSSSMRTSDCELDHSEKDKTAEKEVLSTSLIKTLHTLLKDAADLSEKDVGSTVQESAGDEIDNLIEDKESSRKQELEVKLPRRKKKAKKSATRNKDESAKNKDESAKNKDESANNKDESAKSKDESAKSKDESAKNKDESAKNKDESARHTDESAKNKDVGLMERADNTVSETSSTVPATGHKTKNDKVSMSNAEKHEALEKTSPDDVTMQEAEISKATEMIEETLKEINEAVGRRKKKKVVGRSATRNDAATVTNEENVLPHSGREESQEITINDALLVDDSRRGHILTNNDAEIPKGNDKGIDRKPENQNEKLDGEKRKKRKKKTKKNGEGGGMSTEVSDQHLNDHVNENAKEHEPTLLDAARKEGDEVKKRDAQVFDVGLMTKAKKNKKSSVTGPEGLQSKCQSTELEVEPEKSQSNQNNMTVCEVVKSKDIVNDEGNMSKEGSREVVKSMKVKKPKKKTKEQLLLVDSRNDSAIQPLISKSENKKVSTNVVNDANIPNTDQFKSPEKKSKINTPSKSAHANKAHGEPSAEVFHNQKSDKPRVILGLASVKTVQKSAPEVNKSQHVKSLLSGSGGGDSDASSADDYASPGRSSSSLGNIASGIDSRTDGSSAVKRKGGGGNAQSKSKNISITDRVRSSPRFKRAKVTASQQLGDTESEPVEFVPESPPMAQG